MGRERGTPAYLTLQAKVASVASLKGGGLAITLHIDFDHFEIDEAARAHKIVGHPIRVSFSEGSQ